VLIFIAVSSFRSYFVWLLFCCACYPVIGVSFCFVYAYYFCFTVCSFGVVLLRSVGGWVFYDSWGCFVCFRCGVTLCFGR